MESPRSVKKLPLRGKACWKVTNMDTGEFKYTRDRYVSSSCERGYITKYWDNTLQKQYKIKVEFISNTPPAVEILYFGANDV